jgi:hypothetical protein
MNVGIVSSSNFNLGGLLSTQDGGATWNWAPYSPGVYGVIRFINLKDGWLAGGPGNEHPYATHDGSNSWQEISMKSPPVTGSATVPLYAVPVFSDDKHGFLPVTYTGTEGSGEFLVLLSRLMVAKARLQTEYCNCQTSIGEVPRRLPLRARCSWPQRPPMTSSLFGPQHLPSE